MSNINVSDYTNRRGKLKTALTIRLPNRNVVTLPEATQVEIHGVETLQAGRGSLTIFIPGYSVRGQDGYSIEINKIKVLPERVETNASAGGRLCKLRRNYADTSSNFTMTTAHQGLVSRLSQDGTQYIITIPFGNDKDRTIRVPFRIVVLGPQLPTRAARHRRFTIQHDYTVKNQAQQTIHTLKTGNVSVIDDVVDGGKFLIVKDNSKDQGRTLLRVPMWTGQIADSIDASDIRDHTFKAERDEPNTSGNGGMRSDDIGFTRQFNRPTNEVRICNRTQGKKIMTVPIASVKLGYRYGVYVVNYTPAQFTITTIPRPSSSNLGPSVQITKAVTGILWGIDNQKNALPGTIRRYDDYFATNASRDLTATVFNNGLVPYAKTAFSSSTYSLENLLSKCPAATTREAGIYLRAYWDFRSSSPYHGKVFIYTGKTKDFGDRDRHHNSGPTTDNVKHTQHYVVSAAARKHKAIQIWKHGVAQGSLTSPGDLTRSVMELLVTLFLGSLSNRTLNLEIHSDDPRSLGTVVGSLRLFNNSQVARIWTGIANEVFDKINFPRMTSTSGQITGLNIRVPMGDDSDREKPRWTRQVLSDRSVFMREQLTFQCTWRDSNKHNLNFYGEAFGKRKDVAITIPPDVNNGLTNGTKFHLAFEVMDDEYHEAPFLRVPDIGSFNNWTPNANVANRIGLKIIWKHQGQFFVKCVQREAAGGHLTDYFSSQQGSLNTYVTGVALWEYFTRSNWGVPGKTSPPFYRDLKAAEILDISQNHFRQEINLTLDVSPVVYVGPVVRDLQAAATAMQDLGLENVGGRWQQFTQHSNDPLIKSGRLGRRDMSTYVKNRTTCNRCYLLSLGPQNYDCKNEPGTDRCTGCIERGLPCSWSYVSVLFGDGWVDQANNIRASGKRLHSYTARTPRLQEVEKALFYQPYNVGATTTHPISDDPGLQTLAGSQISEMERDLDAEEAIDEEEAS